MWKVLWKGVRLSSSPPICGYNLVVECNASDLVARVRFPLPAPQKRYKVKFLYIFFVLYGVNSKSKYV